MIKSREQGHDFTATAAYDGADTKGSDEKAPSIFA